MRAVRGTSSRSHSPDRLAVAPCDADGGPSGVPEQSAHWQRVASGQSRRSPFATGRHVPPLRPADRSVGAHDPEGISIDTAKSSPGDPGAGSESSPLARDPRPFFRNRRVSRFRSSSHSLGRNAAARTESQPRSVKASPQHETFRMGRSRAWIGSGKPKEDASRIIRAARRPRRPSGSMCCVSVCARMK